MAAGPHSHKAAFFEALERDETLYSFLATAHATSSSVSAEKTSLDLLGIPHGARQHLFPSRLDPELYGRASNLGDRLALVRGHTVAGFYLPFMPLEEQSFIASRLGLVAHARRQCDGSSQTLRPRHPLKACIKCALRDVDRIGRPFWHVSHQLPLTMTCAEHAVGLVQIEGQNKRWLMPDSPTLACAAGPAKVCDVAIKLARLSELVLLTQAIDVDALRDATIFRLSQLGVLHEGKCALHSRLVHWFRSTSTSQWLLNQAPWISSLAGGDWMASLLWRRKTSHPIRWITLWSALEPDGDSDVGALFKGALNGRCIEGSGQLALFDSELPCGSAPPHVEAAFASSNSYAEAMLALNASRGDIVRWLDAFPDLRRSWRARLRSEKLQTILHSIRETPRTRPEMTRNDLEATHAGEMRWLRDHAPSELNRLRAQISSRANPQFTLFSSALLATVDLAGAA